MGEITNELRSRLRRNDIPGHQIHMTAEWSSGDEGWQTAHCECGWQSENCRIPWGNDAADQHLAGVIVASREQEDGER